MTPLYWRLHDTVTSADGVDSTVYRRTGLDVWRSVSDGVQAVVWLAITRNIRHRVFSSVWEDDVARVELQVRDAIHEVDYDPST